MSLLLYIVFLAFWATVILMFITQVIVPLFAGTRLFPMFREKSPLAEKIEEAETELEEVAELVAFEDKLDELNRRKAELEKK